MRANIISLYNEIKDLEAQNIPENKEFIRILKKQFIEKVRKVKMFKK